MATSHCDFLFLICDDEPRHSLRLDHIKILSLWSLAGQLRTRLNTCLDLARRDPDKDGYFTKKIVGLPFDSILGLVVLVIRLGFSSSRSIVVTLFGLR